MSPRSRGGSWARGSALASVLLALAGAAQARTPNVLLAQRGYAICPLPGTQARSVLIADARAWRGTLQIDATSALGRRVNWQRERVLVHALDEQPTLGVAVAVAHVSGGRDGQPLQVRLRVTRPAEGSAAATALSRPCVLALLRRGEWRSVSLRAAPGVPAERVHVVHGIASSLDPHPATTPQTPVPALNEVMAPAPAASR